MSVAEIAKEQARRFVGLIGFILQLRVNAPSDPEDIGTAVVIEIFDADAPTYKPGFDGKTGAQSFIFEFSFAIVDVDGGCIGGKVRFYDIQAATQQEIADTDAHAGLLHSVFAERDAALHALLRKCSVVIVAEEEAGCGIAGDVDIGPTVIIEIGRNDSQTVTGRRFADSGRGSNISECAVAVIVIKRVAAVGQTARTAEDAFVVTGIALARARDGIRIEGHVIRNKQIKAAVAIVIDKGAAGAEAGLRIPETRFFRDFRKCSVAIIAIKRVLRPTGDEDIFKAVVIEIADSYSIGVAGVKQTSILRDVGEGAVAIVFIEPVRGISGRIAPTRTGQDEEIHPAVVVVIDEGGPAAHGLDNVIGAVRMAGNNDFFQAGLRGDVGEARVKREAGRFAARSGLHPARGHAGSGLLGEEPRGGQGEEAGKVAASEVLHRQTNGRSLAVAVLLAVQNHAREQVARPR